MGSYTADATERSGHTPVIYDNLSAGHRWAVGSKTLVEADLADKPSIRRAIEEYRIGAVTHFAAHANVEESIVRPRNYFQNSAVNSLNLLDEMLDLGVKYIVNSSTCTAYSIPDQSREKVKLTFRLTFFDGFASGALSAGARRMLATGRKSIITRVSPH
jgi:UDP-glucose 4-epimerase